MFWLKKLEEVEDNELYDDSSNSSIMSISIESMPFQDVLRCWKLLAQQLPKDFIICEEQFVVILIKMFIQGKDLFDRDHNLSHLTLYLDVLKLKKQ